MRRELLLSLSIFSLLTFSTLQADDAVETDLSGFGSEEELAFDDLDGFGEDIEITQEEQTTPSSEPSNLSISGNIALKSSYGYRDHTIDGVEYRGINQAQTSLYLQADYKLKKDWKLRVSADAYYDAIYDLRDQPYNDDVLDAYQTQLRFDEAYIQGRLSQNIDVKIGRQIVVWGKSDNIRITDVINPLDNRLPGMTDIEDLRLPTTMLKLDYYSGKWNFSAMAIAESRIFLEAAPYGEFFPVGNIFPSAPNPFFDLKEPSTSWSNMQYAFAANGIFSGWDLSFYASDVYDSKWHLEGSTPSDIRREVSQIKMLGSAINIVMGSWLLKSEVAFLNGIKYNSTLDEKNRVDTLLGFEYMGINDTVLSLEVALKHIFDYEQSIGSLTASKPDYTDENEYQTALRASRTFINDTIELTALVSMFGSEWEYGGFTRVWVEYEVADAIHANFGFVDYIGGDKPLLEAISDNDRVFADITYSF